MRAQQRSLHPVAAALAVLGFLALAGCPVQAEIPGLTGTTFNLTAKPGYISGADGLSLYIWGYANGAGRTQYPGPTLIVNQGDLITINLTNKLAQRTSIVFPGQTGVTATGGTQPPGALTAEADPNTTVTYTFTASEPGTYQYHSGTRPDLQVELGLIGALIVRPAGFDPNEPRAYAHASSAYDREYLFLLTEMDYNIHRLAERRRWTQIDTTTFYPVYWFINGRNLPDVLFPDFTPWLPSQPYSCLPRMHPGDKVLMRVIGGGRDPHPFHTHGNNVTIIARDGRLLESTPGSGADLATSNFTIAAPPGQTVDALFEWTGAKLGWDIYGHKPQDPLQPFEDPDDHGKPLPVALPHPYSLTFGSMYSGSPFLGQMGPVPPGHPMQMGGYFHMWHSHSEKELCNNDIFPGGMGTMLIIDAHTMPIP
ncbi:MAG: multicopper oxidase domain-containing protein [Planctomycetota bacterium]